MADQEAIAIPVPAEDPKKGGADKKDSKKDDKGPGLSAEDEILKETLELAVERLQEVGGDAASVDQALETLCREIKTATTSMTSVPKVRAHAAPHLRVVPAKRVHAALLPSRWS